VKRAGSRELAAPAQAVWDVLNRPEVMAGLLPGVESFEVVDDRHWRAKVSVPLGLGSISLGFDFERVDERPIEHARLHGRGTGLGAPVTFDTSFDLEPNGAGTQLRWEAELRVPGAGAMGERLLQPIFDRQVEDMLVALERQLAAP
jgi:carbon monoxide dehydrogenase subunit G